MTWGAQYMCYTCKKCGKKYKYAIDLIGDFGADFGKCPVCGSPVYEGTKNFYCSDKNCRFVLWKENRYLDRMRTCLDAGMAKDLLARGRTTVKDLYSPKKDSFFTADLLMEWKDGSARYSLDFPDRKTGRKTAAGSRKQDEGNTPG